MRLWYVDCFAGPWKQNDEELGDTSVSIGLKALNAAAATWRAKGFAPDVAAIFVEKDAGAFRRLEKLVSDQKGSVDAYAYHGEFGEHGARINAQLGEDAALLFVDPTGWKGAAMAYVTPLASKRYRDVIVNVMVNFLQRFVDDRRDFLRRQMSEFFGLAADEIPSDLDEDELMRLYRRQLKAKCGVKFAADLAVPHPTRNRTWFRLVVGGNHASALELFRATEEKVVGREAGAVRDAAKRTMREAKSHQPELAGLLRPPAVDDGYDDLRRRGLSEAEAAIVATLALRNSIRFRELWPPLLEEHHLVQGDVAHLIMRMVSEKRLILEELRARQRVPREDQLITRA